MDISSARRSSDSSAPGPTLAAAARAGAAVGGLVAAYLVVIQNAAAWADGVLWTLNRPWLNLPIYGLAGCLAGAAAGPSLELVRRALFRRFVDGWPWLAAWLGLGGFGARPVGGALKRLLVLREPIWQHDRLVIVFLLLVALSLVVLARRRIQGLRPTIAAGLALALPTVAVGFCNSLYFVELKRFGFGLQLALGIGALAVGLLLAPARTGRHRAALASARALAVIGVAAGLATFFWLQRSSLGAARGPVPEGPNVLLIVLDTLRRDAVSAYGSLDGTTPHLDRFAMEGVLWEDAITPGNWTIPSHASLFTGALVTRHGCCFLRSKLDRQAAGPGSRSLPTLAESFAARGWSTAALVANANLTGVRGFDRGFQEYYEIWRASRGNYDPLGRFTARLLGLGVFDKGGDRTVRMFADWLRMRPADNRPWFLFVNFLEPHAPYAPPDPWQHHASAAGLSRRDVEALSNTKLIDRHQYGGAARTYADQLWPLYLDAVAYQDHIVGRMLTDLDEQGVAEDTVVIITSDHGENFGWKGQLDHFGALNDDLIRVPLMARGPGIPQGVREPSPVSLVDIFPTLLYLTSGPPMEPDPGRPGTVMPPLAGEVAAPGERVRIAEREAAYRRDLAEFTASRPEAAAYWAEEQAALLKGPYAVINLSDGLLTRRSSEPEPPLRDGTVELNDPELLRTLLAELAALRSTWPRAHAQAADVAIDAETRERLEALGYLSN